VIARDIISQGTITRRLTPTGHLRQCLEPASCSRPANAKDFIAQAKSLKIEPAGEGESGLAKYRITPTGGVGWRSTPVARNAA
jgi:2',3'-cyclic-nucleotide 2'-phosphodiesterase/3'-nucleotidase